MRGHDLIARVTRAGELLISGDSQAELDLYFEAMQYRFHGSDGFEADYAGVLDCFKAIRAAFDGRAIRHGIAIVERRDVACQTWIEGTFVSAFTHSPAGPFPPIRQRIVWDLINMFRFNNRGRLVEEWVRSDNRSLLRQSGAPGQ